MYLSNAVDTSVPGTDVGTGVMTDTESLALNLSLLQTFFPDYLQTGINPSWSLTTELTFYAVLPLLAVWLVGRSSRRLAMALLPAAVLGVAGLAGRAWAEHLYSESSNLSPFTAEYGANGVAVLSRSLLALGDNFALGMIIAVLFVWTERGELPWWTRRRVTLIAWTFVVIGTVGGLALHEGHPWFMGTFTSLVAAAMILLMVDPAARHEASGLVRFASWRPIEYIGEISLSVYLWHFPILVLVARAGWFDEDSIGTMVGSTTLVAAASIALGAVTFTWIERPAMTGRLPHRPWRQHQGAS